MKCRLVREMKYGPTAGKALEGTTAPIGTVLEHKDASLLVEMGCAVPADEECEKKCGMTQEQMQAAIEAQNRVAAGIHPEDYEAFDRGEMVGYNGDGSWIPGPNYVAPDESDLFDPLDDDLDDEEPAAVETAERPADDPPTL